MTGPEPDADRVRRCARLVLSLIAELKAEPDEHARAILTAAALATIMETAGAALEGPVAAALEAWAERTQDDP